MKITLKALWTFALLFLVLDSIIRASFGWYPIINITPISFALMVTIYTVLQHRKAKTR
jgi:hypothetical protein